MDKTAGRYAGPAGSVRHILKHPTLPVVAAVGLDRMLWLFHTHTKEVMQKFYLKQRLTSALICPELLPSKIECVSSSDPPSSSDDSSTSDSDSVNSEFDCKPTAKKLKY